MVCEIMRDEDFLKQVSEPAAQADIPVADDLLETLIGKLCARLMQLPGVQGVRVKITKLEIFDDCEVAIRMETGHW